MPATTAFREGEEQRFFRVRFVDQRFNHVSQHRLANTRETRSGPLEPVGRHSSSARTASASERQHPAARLEVYVAPHFAFLSSIEVVRTRRRRPIFFTASHTAVTSPLRRGRGMAGNRHLLLVGFTLLGGAVGFYVEDKVEAYYKEQRFRHFEKVVLEKHRARSDDRPSSSK